MAGAEGPGRPVREEARDPDRARSLMFLWATLGSPDFFLKAYSAMAAAKPMKAQAPLFTCVCVCARAKGTCTEVINPKIPFKCVLYDAP